MKDPNSNHYIINYPDYGNGTVGLMKCHCGQSLIMELHGKDIHCSGCGKYFNSAGKSPAECFFGEEKKAEIKKTASVVVFGIVLFIVIAVAAWVILALIAPHVGIQ